MQLTLRANTRWNTSGRFVLGVSNICLVGETRRARQRRDAMVNGQNTTAMQHIQYTLPPPPLRAWSVKTRRAPSRHCRDASAMHDDKHTPPFPNLLKASTKHDTRVNFADFGNSRCVPYPYVHIFALVFTLIFVSPPEIWWCFYCGRSVVRATFTLLTIRRQLSLQFLTIIHQRSTRGRNPCEVDT